LQKRNTEEKESVTSVYVVATKQCIWQLNDDERRLVNGSKTNKTLF